MRVPECCNHDCHQGRDCPNRRSRGDIAPVLAIVLVMYIAALVVWRYL